MYHCVEDFLRKYKREAGKQCGRVCSVGEASPRSCHTASTFITANNLGSGGGRRLSEGEHVFLGTMVDGDGGDASEKGMQDFRGATVDRKGNWWQQWIWYWRLIGG